MNQIRAMAWRLLSRIRNLQQFLIDERRYRRWSISTSPSALKRMRGRNLEGVVTQDYHRIEKGLSLSNPKRPFGDHAKSRLDAAMSGKVWAEGDRYHTYAVDALNALEEWNGSGVISSSVALDGASLGDAGLDREEARQFFTSRRSVRSFDYSRVPDIRLIREAVNFAINSPSVCNRQAWRAHYYETEEAQRVLKHQGGNRGFGDSIPSVFIVTVDTRLFAGSGERNQRWIDGGLFAMTLVWALHALNLRTCMLNWSRSNQDSARLREDASIPDWEEVVVLIGVGYPVDGYRVARSSRRELDEVFVDHNQNGGSGR